jgi:hypothetical protein
MTTAKAARSADIRATTFFKLGGSAGTFIIFGKVISWQDEARFNDVQLFEGPIVRSDAIIFEFSFEV